MGEILGGMWTMIYKMLYLVWQLGIDQNTWVHLHFNRSVIRDIKEMRRIKSDFKFSFMNENKVEVGVLICGL